MNYAARVGAGQAQTTVRVHVLGSFELWIDGALADAPRAQVRSILALLASLDQPTATTDQLIEHVWSDQLPANPRASLRVALTRTRATLGKHSDALVSNDGSHSLRASSDIRDFRSAALALAGAQTERSSADELITILGLVRGAPFSGIRVDGFLQPIAQEVEANRQRILDAATAALVGDKRYDEAVNLAQPNADADPLNETLASSLATALAGVGRRADALSVLERTRIALRDELGLNPGPGFAESEREILQGSVELRPSLSSHGPQPATGAMFVGRDELLEQISEHPGAGLLVITGEPGSGKTRLLAELEVRADKMMLRAQSTATPQRPMEAITNLIVDLVTRVPETLDDESVQAVLSRLAPEQLPEGEATIAAPQTRDALLSQLVSVLNTFASADRCTLLFDDCQWLDRASASVLQYLAGDGACRIIATRRVELPEALGFLADPKLARPLDLRPLRIPDVEEILADGSAATLQMAEEIHARAGGNALFTSLLASMVIEGVDTANELPASILVAVQQRLTSLPDSTQQALASASVFTGPIEKLIVDQLLPGGVRDLEPAVAAGLLTERGSDELRFSHQLVAEAVYQLLPEGRRLELHDELGRLLDERGATAATYAIHCGEAASIDPFRAVASHLAAAREFRNAFAWDTSLLYVQEASRFAEAYSVTAEHQSAEIAILHGAAARALLRPGSDELLLAGARQALTSGRNDLACEALVELCSHGRLAENDQQGHEILQLVRQTLDENLAETQRAELSAAASTLVTGSTLGTEGMELYRDAYAIAQRSGDPELEAKVLLRLDLGMGGPDDFDRRREGARRLAEIAGSDPDLLWEAAFLEYGHAQVLGHDAQVETHLETMRELTPLVRMRNRDFGMAFSEAAFARYQHDYAAATALAQQATEIGYQRYTTTWVDNVCGVLHISIMQSVGGLANLGPLLERHLAAEQVKPYWFALAAEMACEIGDVERVRWALDELRPGSFSALVPDIGWTAKLTALVAPAVYAADREAVEFLRSALAEFGGRNSWSGVCIHRPIDEALAELETFVAS